MPRLPLLFVPGLGGSFNLPVLLDWRAPTLDGWQFPPFLDYGRTFLNMFTSAGYTRDRDLFVAFYDWRKSVNDSARLYLAPWIDRARRLAGADQVVLVAHSMGGLVARSYIQSSGYRGDVARLITLGTPHRGAPEAYYIWEGGDLRWDSTVTTVLDVYLWYLEHAHPFQTGLDRLRTIRTQVMGVRDLLPIDDYLADQAVPPHAFPEMRMRERNLWGELLDAPEGRATLFGRVPVTTISGQGFITIRSLVVQAPSAPTGDPSHYPDGAPTSEQTSGDGDGTVPLASAQIADARARNLPPVSVPHDLLADQAAAQVLLELGTPASALTPAPAGMPRLVIMTASPVKLTVELPAPAPGASAGVLSGEAAAQPPPRRRPRKARVYTYGHRGKQLSMAVISQPDIDTYNVRVRGTATGAFALGALVVGARRSAVLGADLQAEGAVQPPTATPIVTVRGRVVAQAELHYEVVCRSYTDPPQIRFDAESTARDALARLSAVAQAPVPGVLGAETETAARVAGVLSAADVPATLRDTLDAALAEGDTGAAQQLAAVLSGTERPDQVLAAVNRIVAQVVAPRDRELALALIEQLRQVAATSGDR